MAEKEEKVRPGRPRKYENWTAEILCERAREYFIKCDDRTKKVPIPKVGLVDEPDPAPYSVEGLCSYLDILPSMFRSWRKKNDDLGIRAQKIYNKITANRIEGALDGRQNSSFAQFMLKNNNPEDYRDKVEVENTVSEKAATMFENWSAQWWNQRKSDHGSGD